MNWIWIIIDSLGLISGISLIVLGDKLSELGNFFMDSSLYMRLRGNGIIQTTTNFLSFGSFLFGLLASGPGIIIRKMGIVLSLVSGGHLTWNLLKN